MSTPKGHLLFINRIFPPDAGASALRLFELVQGLAERGWKITVLTNKGRNQLPKDLHANITLVRLSHGGEDQKAKSLQQITWPLAFFRRALSLPKADYTITLTDPPMLALASALLSCVRKTKTIHWVHDLYPDLYEATNSEHPLWHGWAMKLSRWALKRHTKIITLGDDMSAILAEDGIESSHLTAISNWPDVEETKKDKLKSPTRQALTNPFVTEGVFTVLYSGNFGRMHNFKPLIEAIKIVHNQPLPIRFIFAGDGEKFTSVRDEIEKNFLTNVHFIRAQPKERFMDLLRAGDVHVSTMIPEALGLAAPSKINSALGLGKPCLYIGPTKASQAQLITRFKAGVVIDVTDAHAKFKLAEAIVQLASDKALYETTQKNALAAAESIAFTTALDKFESVLTENL